MAPRNPWISRIRSKLYHVQTFALSPLNTSTRYLPFDPSASCSRPTGSRCAPPCSCRSLIDKNFLYTEFAKQSLPIDTITSCDEEWSIHDWRISASCEQVLDIQDGVMQVAGWQSDDHLGDSPLSHEWTREQRMVMQCEPRARNSCIEKVGFSSTLLPVFCLSLLPVHSCSKNICSRRFLALHLLSLAGSWPFRNFTFTCHVSFTWEPCVCNNQSKVTPHVRFSTRT